MGFKRVLLANLIAHETGAGRRRTILRAGLGYIAQALDDRGIEYEVADLALGYSPRYLLARIRDFRPDLVGITMLTYRYRDAYQIISAVKEKFPDIPVVCGGPHITTFGEKSLEECRAIDFGIMGEGDETMVQLCSASGNYGDIPGLLYRKDGAVMFSGSKPYIADLNALNFPRYRRFELQNYPLRNSPLGERTIPLVTSRGCPYDCVYCPVKTTIGQKFRFRSVENIVAEMAYWYGQGYRRFSFVDDNFTLIRDRIVKLCAVMRAGGLTGLSMSLPNGIRADKVDRELLGEMHSVGFTNLGIGVEGGNDRMLKTLKKHESMQTIERAIDDACSLGFHVDLFFLVGSPGETEKDVMDSVAIATRYPVDDVFFFNLIPYPETELFDWVKKHGRFMFPPEHYLNRIHSNMDVPVFSTDDFSADSRRAMLRYARSSVRRMKATRYAEKLAGRGIPRLLAYPLSRLYSRTAVRRLFNDVGLMRMLKDKVTKL